MKRIVIATCVATLLILVLTTGSPLTGARAQKGANKYRPIDRGEFVAGRVLVKFRSGIMPDHARNIIATLGARDAGELPNIGVHILDLPYQADEAGFAQAMAQRPEVEFAELDRILAPAGVAPNDPWYPNEWSLTKVSAPDAWVVTTGTSNITIAILDTGVETTHPDLAAKIVPGWNFYDNNSNTSDVVGHGTMVAGTAAASSNNGQGVASVAWGCSIMPIRISDLNGYATYSAAANGLTWAADHGARVANISYIMTDSSTVTSAASYFQSKGGVVAISAGNNTTFDSSADNQSVLTVTAMSSSDVLYSWSNTGNNVDLAAPGFVYTTIRGGGYSSASGTSVAAPIVAGVAALVLSANPTLSGSQVQDILKQSADDFGSAGWDPSYGWGRVNAAHAVALAAGGGSGDATTPGVGFSSPANGSTVSGTISVTVSASDNIGVSSVSLSVDGVSLATDVASPYTFTWNTTGLANGTHTLGALAADAAGNTAVASISVMVNNTVDSSPPTIRILSPTDGSPVSGMVSVMVSTSDDASLVTRVELYVDGVLRTTSTSAPFTTKWNTRKEKSGSHLLQSKAYDALGKVGSSAGVTVYK
jgi:hypothetical protein